MPRCCTYKRRPPALAAYDPCTGFRLLSAPVGTVVFERKQCLEAVVVALNLTDQPQRVPLPVFSTSASGGYQPVFRPDNHRLNEAGSCVLLAHSYQVFEQKAMPGH